jgi:hypothetical protein
VRVQIASHAPGSPWTSAVDLSDAGQDAGAPALSLSSTGFGALIWTRSDGAHVRIQVSRRVPGGSFGSADTISTAGVDAGAGFPGFLPGPQIAVDAAGDIVAIWLSSDSTTVFARRYTAATGLWGSIDTLATGSANQTFAFPNLIISKAGVATAAWSFDNDSSTTTTDDVQTRTQATNGSWTPMVQLTTTATGFESGDPQLAVDDAGNVSMVWFLYSTASCGFLCTSLVTGVVESSTLPAASGVWQPAQALSDRCSSRASPASPPARRAT